MFGPIKKKKGNDDSIPFGGTRGALQFERSWLDMHQYSSAVQRSAAHKKNRRTKAGQGGTPRSSSVVVAVCPSRGPDVYGSVGDCGRHDDDDEEEEGGFKLLGPGLQVRPPWIVNRGNSRPLSLGRLGCGHGLGLGHGHVTPCTPAPLHPDSSLRVPSAAATPAAAPTAQRTTTTGHNNYVNYRYRYYGNKTFQWTSRSVPSRSFVLSLLLELDQLKLKARLPVGKGGKGEWMRTAASGCCFHSESLMR